MSDFTFRLFRRVRYWRARRTAIPLMAQALYEPLSKEEEARRDQLFTAFPELAEEFESLQRVSRAIHLSEDSWAGDLLPALKERIAFSEAPRGERFRYGPYLAAASVAALLSVGVYGAFMLYDNPGAGAGIPRAALSQPRSETRLSQMRQEACDLVSQGETERAAALLEQAIQDYPQDAYHADALLTLADIEYTYLQRYDRAYEVFKSLERYHRDIFNRSWDHDKRVRLLSAALPDAFEPLREYEVAGNSANPLAGYESILARYPDQVWAQEAMQSMARLVAHQPGTDPTDSIQVLRQVRNACANPVARERVDLELGNYFCDSLDDPELARTHYIQAAASQHAVVSAQAREALARLE